MIDAGDAILPGEAPNDDIVEAGAGNDTVFAGLGDDEVWGRDGDDDLYGEEGDDYLSGGEGDDLLVGGAGNDTLDAGQGVDTLYGGEGDDLLLGGPTTDFLDGGTGNDTLNGGNNADTIYGGDGNDVANGEFGDDYIDVSGTNPILDNPPVPGLPADATPNDDRDYVDGGEGNDTILTGDDADTIYGGAGNDSIDAGIDDDYIDGGDGDDTIDGSIGNDTIYGGAGNDSIIAGIDAASDYVGDDPHFPLGDPNKNDGRDFVDAGAGDDYVFTGDDSDTIYGGTGNDTIHAGIDDDFIYGGDGNDEITGGHGSDYIEGGDGDDVINAGDSTLLYGQAPDATDPVPTNGRDTVDGGAGNDYIEGQDDNDLLMGGTGNDTIDGGIDNDTILGGEGDDLIIGGEGADDLQGGTGDDYFDGATAGDVVLGGEDADGNDIDTLDLRGSGAIRITYDPADSEAGTVEFLDGVGGPVTGTMTFSEIENVIPCFTPGTSIATPKGERLVEELKVGDKVITRDNGIQEIRWLGAKDMDWKQLALNPHLKPILVRAGSLGNGLPERDMMVSPNHRLLVANDKTALYFEENEVLAAAKHLVNNRGIHEVETMGTQYIHFMFDNHEVVLSNGAWTESFQPGDYTLEGIGNAQRNEILELFPELKTAQGIEAYQSARRTLKKHEARLLVD
jgi:Ca2+-binding RTX toxin-like protein